MTREETLQRARQAAEILEHPIVVEALAMMRAHILARWGETASGGMPERESLFQQFRAVHTFETIFRALINDGKFLEGRKRQDDAAR